MAKYDNSFRQQHKLENKFVVLYSGNIARTQGVRTIIRAAGFLQHIPKIEFVIVGEQRQLGELEDLRDELGLSNVTLLPFASRQELPTMLAAADVSLILQKANMVGFNMPSKTMLLLASGRPIIASVPSGGSAAVTVRDSGGGLVVDPERPAVLAEAVEKLYGNPEQGQKLGRQGRQFAIANYSFEQALEAYEGLLIQTAQRSTSQPQLPTINGASPRSSKSPETSRSL